MISYKTLRPLIFHLSPERAHRLTMALLCLGGSVPPAENLMRLWFGPTEPAPVRALGLTFPNAVGLAAGYDKDGQAWRGLAALGFGHVEIGTVTPRAQPGNAGPRLFRLPGDQAVINRMGFPSQGAVVVARRLRDRVADKARPGSTILGVNIGKNRSTPLEEAGEDYLELLRTFGPLADYLAINVSSPNTPGLRSLQTRPALEALLRPLACAHAALAHDLGRPVPLLVKLAPDLTPDALDGALEASVCSGMDGLIISNTTVERSGLHSPLAREAGGLSGAPLRARATELVRQVARLTGHSVPIVASGGIMTPDDACARLDAGATLVQIYTGMIYAGPGLVHDVAAAIASTGDRRTRPVAPKPVLPYPKGALPTAVTLRGSAEATPLPDFLSASIENCS